MPGVIFQAGALVKFKIATYICFLERIAPTDTPLSPTSCCCLNIYLGEMNYQEVDEIIAS